MNSKNAVKCCLKYTFFAIAGTILGLIVSALVLVAFFVGTYHLLLYTYARQSEAYHMSGQEEMAQITALIEERYRQQYTKDYSSKELCSVVNQLLVTPSASNGDETSQQMCPPPAVPTDLWHIFVETLSTCAVKINKTQIISSYPQFYSNFTIAVAQNQVDELYSDKIRSWHTGEQLDGEQCGFVILHFVSVLNLPVNRDLTNEITEYDGPGEQYFESQVATNVTTAAAVA